MRKVYLILSAVVMAVMMLSSCGSGGSDEELSLEDEELSLEEIMNTLEEMADDEEVSEEVTSGSDEVTSGLNEVTIGEQVWMTQNLNVDTFRNGDPIPEAVTIEQWREAGRNRQPAWCYYDNFWEYGEIYGKLYNWYAVNDSRGLAPVGYHIPSDAEWTELENFLGTYDAGIKMKSTSAWKSYGNGTNSSGFSGFPGGMRHSTGAFESIGWYGKWWSSTEVSTDNAWFSADYAWHRYLNYDYDNVLRSNLGKDQGFSVRCLRD